MIELDLKDPTVLRRVLEELEDAIVGTKVDIAPIDKLDSSADLITTVIKLN